MSSASPAQRAYVEASRRRLAVTIEDIAAILSAAAVPEAAERHQQSQELARLRFIAEQVGHQADGWREDAARYRREDEAEGSTSNNTTASHWLAVCAEEVHEIIEAAGKTFTGPVDHLAEAERHLQALRAERDGSTS